MLRLNARQVPVVIVVGLSALVCATCGYVSAGQWDNDPRNWERAFHQSLPRGWQIVHSRCYRYPHFTWEGGYYFHVRVASEADNSYMHPDYFRLTAEQAKSRSCDSTPAWFPPRELSDYEIWGAPSVMDRYIVYVHKNRRDVYFADCQY